MPSPMPSVTPSPSSTSPPNVFISYARGDEYDRLTAERIGEALRLRKVTRFRDSESIPPGADWEQAIREALQAATHFVVILSAEAAAREWVRNEIAIAVERWRKGELAILPLRRSRNAAFPELAAVNEIPCKPLEEPDTVLRWLQLPPLNDDPLGASAAFRSFTSPQKELAELCDRDQQEMEFRHVFRAATRAEAPVPQAFVIAGCSDDQHDSFIDRLRRTYLDKRAALNAASSFSPLAAATAAQYFVDWPPPYKAAMEQRELLANLFEQLPRGSLQPRINDLSADNYVALARQMPETVVALRHEMRHGKWSSAAELLKFYLRFWREVTSLDCGREFVLFFSVVWNPADPPEHRQTIVDDLQKLAVRSRSARSGLIPVTVLTPLNRIEQSHVRAWFRQREERLFVRGAEVCSRLFRRGRDRSMDDVTDELRRTIYVDWADRRNSEVA